MYMYMYMYMYLCIYLHTCIYITTYICIHTLTFPRYENMSFSATRPTDFEGHRVRIHFLYTYRNVYENMSYIHMEMYMRIWAFPQQKSLYTYGNVYENRSFSATRSTDFEGYRVRVRVAFMYVYTCIYISICIQSHYIHVFIYTYPYTYAHIPQYEHVSFPSARSTDLWPLECVRVCVLHIYIYIQIFTYTQNSSVRAHELFHSAIYRFQAPRMCIRVTYVCVYTMYIYTHTCTHISSIRARELFHSAIHRFEDHRVCVRVTRMLHACTFTYI